jgi:hypothetical protein
VLPLERPVHLLAQQVLLPGLVLELCHWHWLLPQDQEQEQRYQSLVLQLQGCHWEEHHLQLVAVLHVLFQEVAAAGVVLQGLRLALTSLLLQFLVHLGHLPSAQVPA